MITHQWFAPPYDPKAGTLSTSAVDRYSEDCRYTNVDEKVMPPVLHEVCRENWSFTVGQCQATGELTCPSVEPYTKQETKERDLTDHSPDLSFGLSHETASFSDHGYWTYQGVQDGQMIQLATCELKATATDMTTNYDWKAEMRYRITSAKEEGVTLKAVELRGEADLGIEGRREIDQLPFPFRSVPFPSILYRWFFEFVLGGAGSSSWTALSSTPRGLPVTVTHTSSWIEPARTLGEGLGLVWKAEDVQDMKPGDELTLTWDPASLPQFLSWFAGKNRTDWETFGGFDESESERNAKATHFELRHPELMAVYRCGGADFPCLEIEATPGKVCPEKTCTGSGRESKIAAYLSGAEPDTEYTVRLELESFDAKISGGHDHGNSPKNTDLWGGFKEGTSKALSVECVLPKTDTEGNAQNLDCAAYASGRVGGKMNVKGVLKQGSGVRHYFCTYLTTTPWTGSRPPPPAPSATSPQPPTLSTTQPRSRDGGQVSICNLE